MKSIFRILTVLSVAASALAAPAKLENRNNNDGITDLDILQYALTLEYLEISLYEDGVNAFDEAAFVSAGYTANDRRRFEEIISQELQHIATLRQSVRMLGAEPTQPCTYKFPPIPTVQAFLNNTDIINQLGPSAYVGAGQYISNKMILTTGSSIGNIETRHNSWLNGIIGRDEFPATFQLPLTPTQAYSVARPFIASCPSTNPKLNAVLASPPDLAITNPGAPGVPLVGGATVNLQPGPEYSAPSGTVNVAFLYSMNTTIVPFNGKSATLPNDAVGSTYAVLTTASPGEELTVGNTLTALAAAFVDVPASRFAGYDYQPRSYDLE